MAQSTDFTIGQGESFKILVAIADSTNIPIDLATQNFSGSIRETYSAENVSANFTIEKIVPLDSGSLYVKLSATDTAQFAAQDYVYDVLMVSESVTRRIIEGKFIVRPSVTR